MAAATRPTINDFLELHAWTVFDVDDAGRVLAGSDASGSMQLVEIDTAGMRRPATANSFPAMSISLPKRSKPSQGRSSSIFTAARRRGRSACTTP